MSHLRAAAVTIAMAIIISPAVDAQQLPNFRDDRRLPQSNAVDAEAKRKADEEARLTAEAEAKRRTDEEARRLAEAEAKRRADEEARRLAEAETKRRADEEARRLAEAEAKRRADEEARRLAEAEAKRRADEEARRLAEVEAKRRADEEARRLAEAEAKRRADEEARRLAEVEAKRKADAEARRLAEAEAKQRADEIAARELAARVADSQRLVTRGRQFFADGDIASARLLFERAADAGNAEAARDLAGTYDSALLLRRGLPAADASVAVRDTWLRKAAELQAILDRAGVQAPAAPFAPATQAAPAIRPPQPVPTARGTSNPPAPATGTETSWPRVLGAITVPAGTDLDAARYLARGRQQRANGDFNAARLFFERAAEAKSAAAAVELAMTFDPEILRDALFNTAGASGDRVQARAWYERAAALGVVGLGPRIQSLAGP